MYDKRKELPTVWVFEGLVGYSSPDDNMSMFADIRDNLSDNGESAQKIIGDCMNVEQWRSVAKNGSKEWGDLWISDWCHVKAALKTAGFGNIHAQLRQVFGDIIGIEIDEDDSGSSSTTS